MSDLESTPKPLEIPVGDTGDTPKIQPPAPNSGSSKIHTFEQRLISGKHEDKWTRTPNSTGTGAIHVKSFHSKFSQESLKHLDQQINEWLDEHLQYEVKMVTTSHGEWKGQHGNEACLIVQVWV